MVYCAHCGNALQSDRHRGETPLYRERHAHECPSNNTSSVAEALDQQMATIIKSLTLPPDWRQRMARLVAETRSGPDPEVLWDKRRRLARAYADGAFSDDEYAWKMAATLYTMNEYLPNWTSTPSLRLTKSISRKAPLLGGLAWYAGT